jgi:BlaI family penicillinase repressor
MAPMTNKPAAVKPVSLTGAEWTIIKAVWERQPCTAPAVQEAVQAETSWAYSTVRTLMDRMTAKGLLASKKMSNHTLYRARVTRLEVQKVELLRALKQAFNGALSPMVECLLDAGEASPEELDRLETWLREKRKQPAVKLEKGPRS